MHTWVLGNKVDKGERFLRHIPILHVSSVPSRTKQDESEGVESRQRHNKRLTCSCHTCSGSVLW